MHQRRPKHQLHAVVDGLENPVTFLLSAGNDHDSIHAIELSDKVKISGSNVLADRAYGAQMVRAYISKHGARALTSGLAYIIKSAI